MDASWQKLTGRLALAMSALLLAISTVTSTETMEEDAHDFDEWGDFTLTPLVRHGLYCKNIKDIQVDEVPQTTDPPLKMSIYELISDSSANTLHLFMHSPTKPYKYLVLMAINENGTPTGHFHHQICSDPKAELNGVHNINRYCTRKETEVGHKWGDTSLMYITPREGHTTLGEQDAFWSWHPKDGERPKKLQFRLAVIQDVKDGKKLFWVNILSPVIAVRKEVEYSEANDADMSGVKCYADILDDESDRNFILASDQTPLKVNMKYMTDLFPDFKPPTTTTTIATTSSTTEEPIIPIDYEDWGDFVLTPLVQYGLYCKNVKDLIIDGIPQNTDPVIKLTVYELIADSSAFTLHLVMDSSTKTYNYLVLMAINEKGIPAGHFHHQVCSDAESELNGLHNVNRYCTKKEDGLGKKWDDTSLMFITPRPGQAALEGKQDAFWSWHSKDGERPSKLQFRLAVVKTEESKKSTFWVNILSPVIELRDRIKYVEANDADMAGVKCFKDILDKKSSRNFVLALDQAPLKINMEYMTDLFPDLSIPTTTTMVPSTALITTTVITTETPRINTTSVTTTTQLSTTTKFIHPTTLSTTEEPIIPIDYEEWGDFTLTPLVRHGLYCKNIKDFTVGEDPQPTNPPLKIDFYELTAESSAYTLHLVVDLSTQSYQYMVLMAINEKGVPTGHFHHQVCSDSKAELNGLHNINRYCTKKENGLGQKWGDTSLMFITPKRAEDVLIGQQDAFWSWHPKDGVRPSKLQFRLAVIKTEDNKENIFWVNILSPVIEVRDKIKYVEANDADMVGVKCFANTLNDISSRNFVLSLDQTALKVSMEYMADLFPDLRVPTTTTLPTTTVLPSTTITTTAMATTEKVTTTVFPTTVAPTSTSVAASTSTVTTSQPTTTTELVPTTTELITTTETTTSTLPTTEEPIISIDYDAWGDFTLTSLVRHGLFCKNIREFDVGGTPQTSDPPLKLSIYELIADSSAYTLHLFMHSPTQPYQFLVIMVINEKGAPTGHFHHQVCSDAKNELNGVHNINRYCTRKEDGVGKKWGDTSLMFITPRPGVSTLGEQDAFWSWHPKDGERPSRLQFRLAVIQMVEGKAETFWVNILSPIIEVRDKIKYVEANDADMAAVKCFANSLDEKSNRNFIVSADQTPLRVNMNYMADLFPDLWVPTTTTLSPTTMTTTAVITTPLPSTAIPTIATTITSTIAPSTLITTTSKPSTATEIVPTTTEFITTKARPTTPSTTEEPIISIDYDEWGDFMLTPLVRHGLYCKNIREIDINGDPETTDAPVKLTIYELVADSSANTLHLSMHSPTQPYHYLVIMAINEKGIPTGHFHHQVCKDPKLEQNGVHNVNRYCTQEENGVGEKWGDTSLMFITPRIGHDALREQDAFWSWHPKDGGRPSKLQFRLAVIQNGDEGKKIFWAKILSLVIEVRDKIKYVEANDADMSGVECFANILDEKSDRNFVIAPDQTPLKVNMEYMIDLFPDLRVPTTTTAASTTILPSTTMITTTVVTTEIPTTSTSTSTVTSTPALASSTPATTSTQQSLAAEVVSTTTELSTTTEVITTTKPVTTTEVVSTTTELRTTTEATTTTEPFTTTEVVPTTTELTSTTQNIPTTMELMTTTEVVPTTTETVRTTAARASTVSTTEEPIISIDYEEWGDFTLTPLVRHGLYCKNIREIEVDGTPQTTDPPIKLYIYELTAETGAYTLHLVMRSPSESYNFLVLMAINEKGIPTGHFHHQVCADAKTELNGLHNINRYCTKKEDGFGKKWGDTSLMFITPRPGRTGLAGEQGAFWSWHPKDGERPSKLQFRMAIVKTEDNKRSIFWVNILSPVIKVRDKIKYVEANDADMAGVKCFKDVLDEKSDRNFMLDSDQTPLKVNMEYMTDLFPGLRVPTTTTSIPSTMISTTTVIPTEITFTSTTTPTVAPTTSSVPSTPMPTSTISSTTTEVVRTTTEEITTTKTTTSTLPTTEEPIISIDYEEWGDFTLTPLVRHGLYCKNIKEFEVDVTPQTTDPPVKLTIYELIADSSAYTLHLFMHSPTQSYKYLVLMATNEKGIPTGHFHHQVCSDPRAEQDGLHNINRYCTKKESGFGEKWGDTSLMFITPRPGVKIIKEQDAFWSWHPKDGTRPTKLQFRVAVIKSEESKQNTFWVNIMSPVIEVRDKIKYVEANDADMTGVKCFVSILDEKSDRNFIIATDQTPLKVNMEYMIDLFPDLRVPTTTTPATTTAIPSTAITTTAMVTTGTPLTSTASPTTVTPISSSLAVLTSTTTSSPPTATTELVPTTTELITTAATTISFFPTTAPVMTTEAPTMSTSITTEVSTISTTVVLPTLITTTVQPTTTTAKAVPTTTKLLTTTKARPTTPLTTEEPIISIDYEEWGDFTLTPLVRHGLYCKNIRDFEVEGVPQTTDPPVKLTIYELIADSSSYTLHLFVHSLTQLYHYLVLIATNEKGIPTGHFHHQVCSDARTELNGLHSINRYCTKNGTGVGAKWGDTSLMYIMPRKGKTALGEQDAFWSWHPKDGVRPSKLQFRVAVIKAEESKKNIFWVNVVSPVIEVRDKIKYVEANDADMTGVKCFKDIFNEKSNRNFITAADQTPLKVNMEYMIDLFPDLRIPTTTTPVTTTVLPSTTAMTTTTLTSTNIQVTSTATPTEVSTTTFISSTSMVSTTQSSTTAKAIIPTTTEVIATTAVRQTTSSTTEEPIIPIDYEEWGDFILSPLVRYGLYCKNIKEFEVEGVPQKTEPPLKLTIYEMIADSSANTLHLVMHSPTQSYKYLLLMAINEKGIPTGHFHHQVCVDAKTELNGLHNLNRYCTMKGKEFGEKWGDTSLMYITPKLGHVTLGEQDAFWSWHPKDGERPSRLQFRLAVIQSAEDNKNIFWVKILSPVIEFREKIKYVEANDADMAGVKCFAKILDEKSDRNFIFATDQTPLKVNMEYMIDLFPDLRPTTTALPSTTTEELLNMTSTTGSPISSSSTAVLTTMQTTTPPATTPPATTSPPTTSQQTTSPPTTSPATTSPTTTSPATSSPAIFSSTVGLITTETESRSTTTMISSTHTVEITIAGSTTQLATTRAPTKAAPTTEVTIPAIVPTTVTTPQTSTVAPSAAILPANTSTEGPALVTTMQTTAALQVPTTPSPPATTKVPTAEIPSTAVMKEITEFVPSPTRKIEPTVEVISTTEGAPVLIYVPPQSLNNPAPINITWENSYSVDKKNVPELDILQALIDEHGAKPFKLPDDIFGIHDDVVQAMSKERAFTAIDTAPSAMKPKTRTLKTSAKVEKTEAEGAAPAPAAEVEDEEGEEDSLGARSTGNKLEPPNYNKVPPFNLLRAKHVYHSCKMGKGCLGDTVGCVKRRNCKILVTYSTNHDRGESFVRFELIGPLRGTQGYVAVGISDDRKMGEDLVVECVMNSDGSEAVFYSWNKEHDNYRPPDSKKCTKMTDGKISKCNATQEDGNIICHFFMETTIEIERHTFDLTKKPYYIFQSIGSNLREIETKSSSTQQSSRRKRSLSIRSQERTKSKKKKKRKRKLSGQAQSSGTSSFPAIGKHTEVHISRKPVRISKNEEHEPTYREKTILKLHGVFMIIAWIVIIPNAAFIARYFKESYRHVQFFGYPVWLLVHIVSIAFAAFFIILGAAFALYHTFGVIGTIPCEYEEWVHFIVGWIACALFFVQVVIGTLRPKEAGIGKMIVDAVHFFVGTISYILALFLFGRSHLLVASYFPCNGALLILMWIVWSLLVHAVVSINTFLTDHHDLHLKTLRAVLPWPFPVITEKPVPGEFFRTNAFAFHAAGAAIAGTWLIVPYLVSKQSCDCHDNVCF